LKYLGHSTPILKNWNDIQTGNEETVVAAFYAISTDEYMKSPLLTWIAFFTVFHFCASVIKNAYIHIPFCRQRCYYCNFAVQIVGQRPATQENSSKEYTEILLRDIEHDTKQHLRLVEPLQTIYFGGGTPSIMNDYDVYRILKKLDDLIGIDKNCEITFEMDPGTFTKNKLEKLVEYGVNRVSLGVQSFNENILKACGRAHSEYDNMNAISMLNDAGLENYSIDLISSLPTLTLDLWESTLDTAMKVNPKHISIYDLQIEDKTAFGKWYQPGVFPLPTEEVSVEMYKLAVNKLTKQSDYEHYEVSNYSKNGYRSKHNQIYWKCLPSFGFGMSAASFINNQRYTKPSSMLEYNSYVNNLVNSTIQVGTIQEEFPDILDVVMLALRTKDGLDLNQIIQNYSVNDSKKIVKSLQKYIDSSLVLHDPETNNVRLTDPGGFLLSNEIISTVFAVFL